MTELLKDTLNSQAAGAEPPELDLDAVIALGERRIRRRRAGTLLGTAFVALAVIAAGLTAVRLVQSDPQPAAKAPIPFTEQRPTYAVNGVIHFGDAEIATGTSRLDNFVQTDAGFLFADRGEIKLADGGTPRKIADAVAESRLVASGPLAGWEEPTTTGTRTVIRDVRTNQLVYEVNHPSGPHSSPPSQPTRSLVALDGDSAYFAVAGGLLQTNVRTHLGQMIRPAPAAVVTSLRYSTSTDIYLAKGPHVIGKYAIAAGGAVRVYDSQGRQYLTAVGAKPKTFGQWLNDTTFTAADAPGRNQSVNLLKCWVPADLTMSCGIAKPAIATSTDELTFPSN